MNKRKCVATLKFAAMVAAVILLIFTAVFFAGRGIFRALYPLDYIETVDQYAEEYSVPRVLLFAVIHTESGFQPDAVSSAGAMGLTQITPETFHWLQTKTGETLPDEALFAPETAIRYGALFYSLLLTEFDNDWFTAVAAYHAGRGQVNIWLSNPEYSADGKTLDAIPSKDTNHYVHKVFRAVEVYYNLYEKEFADNV